MNNIAFIDGQNLHINTTEAEEAWRVDLVKFRIYLRDRYKVSEAYYFLGFIHEKNQDLYGEIQKAGFILIFKLHNSAMIGKKKGNVDTDIVFNIMKKIYKREIIGKVILVSGDGDYKNLVDFLIEENKFCKILFPNYNSASSLYKKLSHHYFESLDKKDVLSKIKRGP